MRGREKEADRETYRTKTGGDKQRNREDVTINREKDSGLLCSSTSTSPSSIMFRCRVYKYPISLQGQFSPAGRSLPPLLRPPPLSSLFLVQLHLTPTLTSLLHRLIRILGLVRASSPGGPADTKADSI